jgi:sulfate transporter 4
VRAGLPAFTAGWWFPIENAGQLLALSVIICFIDICESVSIAKAMAATNKYQLNATQELRGEGEARLWVERCRAGLDWGLG